MVNKSWEARSYTWRPTSTYRSGRRIEEAIAEEYTIKTMEAHGRKAAAQVSMSAGNKAKRYLVNAANALVHVEGPQAVRHRARLQCGGVQTLGYNLRWREQHVGGVGGGPLAGHLVGCRPQSSLRPDCDTFEVCFFKTCSSWGQRSGGVGSTNMKDVKTVPRT